MKNIITLAALAISLGLIIYLFTRMQAAERELATAQRRSADCELVTFQLQNELSQFTRGRAVVPESTAPKQ